MKRSLPVLVILGFAVAAPALAQSTTYPVRRMDFDLWCTEQQHLPADRCDKRLPDDVQKFDAYRAVIERYEIPYLQDKEQRANFDRNVLHNDPVDRNPDDPIKPPPQPTDGR